MKVKTLATVVVMTFMVMFATASYAIDTVPLPEKPTSSIWSWLGITGTSGGIMIGTWPTPEKPKYPINMDIYRIRR